MRYLMRQKLFSWGDDFVIKDADGQDRFVVDAKVFSLRNHLELKDLDGVTLLTIRQRLLAWGPTYEVLRGAEPIAVVKKSLFTLLHCRFNIDVPGPDDLEARGSLFDHEYTVTHVTDGRAAANVSQRWFSLTDSYGVDVHEGEDDLLVLATTVIIDLCCHGDEADGH
jgi:uncharacterized protein YxjI